MGLYLYGTASFSKGVLIVECELTNMIMIENPGNGDVVVQNRVKYWKGITFPGGHVEKGESFVESVIREAKEETGLDIKNPKLCGAVHWCHKDTDSRYFVLLFKTDEYSGTLIEKTDEGNVFWTSKESLSSFNLSPNFSEYLKVFLSDKNEAFGLYRDNEDDDIMQIL